MSPWHDHFLLSVLQDERELVVVGLVAHDLGVLGCLIELLVDFLVAVGEGVLGLLQVILHLL